MAAKKEKEKSEGAASPLPIHPAVLEAHATPVLQSVAQWKEQGRVPPVLLLSGPRGVGKRTLAYWITQTLQCERAGFSKPPETEETGDMFGGALFGDAPPATETVATTGAACGECSSCLRALHGNMLDFREITPEKDSETLKIDQFRDIKSTQGFGSYSGSYRVFLIPEAERMTTQAANSLLKLLEEPPPGWIILLTAADPTLLPSTVISRCQMMRIRPIAEPLLMRLLLEQGVPAERIQAAAKLSQGSLGRALDLAREENWEKRGEILGFVDRPQAHLNALIDWAAGEPARVQLLLDQFEQILSDLIRYAELAGREGAPAQYAWVNLDGARTLHAHAGRVLKKLGSWDRARNFWTGRAERLFRLRREVQTPLNSKLLLQDFLIPWMEAA